MIPVEEKRENQQFQLRKLQEVLEVYKKRKSSLMSGSVKRISFNEFSSVSGKRREIESSIMQEYPGYSAGVSHADSASMSQCVEHSPQTNSASMSQYTQHSPQTDSASISQYTH